MDKFDKSVGAIKEIDNLGQIVIPKKFRSRLNLEHSVEVILTPGGILIINSKFKLVSCDQNDDTMQKNGSNWAAFLY